MVSIFFSEEREVEMSRCEGDKDFKSEEKKRIFRSKCLRTLKNEKKIKINYEEKKN